MQVVKIERNEISQKGLGNLGFLGFELCTEVAPFVRETIQASGPLFAFLMEGVSARGNLVGGGIGWLKIWESGSFGKCGYKNLFLI